MDARFKPHRVNDPKLRDAEARIKRGLPPYIIGKARIRDFHDEKSGFCTQASYACLCIKEYKIGFEISVLASAGTWFHLQR